MYSSMSSLSDSSSSMSSKLHSTRGFKRVVHFPKDPTEEQNRNNVYVKGLPVHVGSDYLYQLFGRFGEISSIKTTKKSIAFVRFERAKDASMAIETLNGQHIMGCKKPLNVRLANTDIITRVKSGYHGHSQRPQQQEAQYYYQQHINYFTSSPREAFEAVSTIDLHQRAQQSSCSTQSSNFEKEASGSSFAFDCIVTSPMTGQPHAAIVINGTIGLLL